MEVPVRRAAGWLLFVLASPPVAGAHGQVADSLAAGGDTALARGDASGVRAAVRRRGYRASTPYVAVSSRTV
jgi:hypothetical protein